MYIDKTDYICYYVIMLNEIQTNTLKNFVVTIDGEEQKGPSELIRATQGFATALSKVNAQLKLEARMWAFDKRHGTNYRTIRHALIEKQRREQFEKSIGLVRTK